MEVYVSTTTKFTPGPWSASKLIGVDDLGIVNGYGSAVARIGNLDIANPANAALIAAAPELYEALHDACLAIEALLTQPGDETRRPHAQYYVDRARIALAKARGEVVS